MSAAFLVLRPPDAQRDENRECVEEFIEVQMQERENAEPMESDSESAEGFAMSVANDQPWVLSGTQTAAFLEAFENPGKPSPALIAAAARYRKIIKRG